MDKVETPYFLPHEEKKNWCRKRLNDVILCMSNTTDLSESQFRPKPKPEHKAEHEPEREPEPEPEREHEPTPEHEREPEHEHETIADKINQLSAVPHIDDIVKVTERERQMTLESLKKMEAILEEVKKPKHFSRRDDAASMLKKYKDEVIKRKKTLLKITENNIDKVEAKAKQQSKK